MERFGTRGDKSNDFFYYKVVSSIYLFVLCSDSKIYITLFPTHIERIIGLKPLILK